MKARTAASLAVALVTGGCSTLPEGQTYVTMGDFPGHPAWESGQLKSVAAAQAPARAAPSGPALTLGDFPGHPIWGARFPQVAQRDTYAAGDFPPPVIWSGFGVVQVETKMAGR